MGKTAALGLKMLWTMGCPPSKVNTQTTHSCPSPKHAYTLTDTHLYTHIHLCPYFLFLTCLQEFFFFFNVRSSDFWKWIPCPFLNGRLTFFPAFEFADHIPKFFFFFPKHNLLIHSCSRHTDPSHTQDLEDTSFSLNLNPFRSSHVVSTPRI